MPRVPADFNGGCYHGAAGIMRSTADSLYDRAGVNGWAVAGAAGVLLGAPLFVAYAWVCCRTYGGDLTRPLAALATDAPAALHRLLAVAPRPTAAGFAIFAVWYLLQAVLMLLLPGRTTLGAVTPAGHRLAYHLNGLRAWLVTHALLYLAAFRWGLFRPTLVYE